MRGFTDETAPHQITFEAYGVALRICASTADLLSAIQPYLPPGWRPRGSSPETHRMGIVAEDDGMFTVYDGDRPINKGGLHGLSLIVLDTRMRMYVAVHSPGRIFVHAGAVAHEGRAIVIPGVSYAGKTSLVAALVRAGAAYYSDEFAVLDDRGLVHPYPKTLSLRIAADKSQVEHAVGELGGTAGDRPVPIGLVLLTHYVQGATWDPRSLSAGQAALAMVSHTVPARLRPEQTLRALTQALGDAIVLEGERGEADQIADRLLSLMARPTVP